MTEFFEAIENHVTASILVAAFVIIVISILKEK